MDATERSQRIARVRAAIEKDAFVPASDALIITRKGSSKSKGWLLDIRNILMRSEVMDDLSALFWDTVGNARAVQIGCLESAGIPLMAAIVSSARAHGVARTSGFFIRKSRKKDGLVKMIEGTIERGAEIILVDDLVNSGKSLMRQVEVVEAAGHKVAAIWTLVRFRDEEYYVYFKEKGIRMHSIFTLDDLSRSLGTSNLDKKERPLRGSFKILWRFAAADPNYFHVVPKSDPAMDDESVFFGSDSGIFWALDKKDGSVAWQYRTGFHARGKGIFSSPALHDGTVYFGSYDGNVYALDAKTGKKRWVFMEADWVGSSPAIAPDLGLMFIGLEFGLWRKRGAIVALDLTTGKKAWSFEMRNFTHSSPLYIASKGQVIIGSNDGCAYLFDAKTGAQIWKFETAKLSDEDYVFGTTDFDIKESFAYDVSRDVIAFGTREGRLIVLERASGREVFSFRAEFGFYSTPLIHDGLLIASSLDKFVYCFDLDTHEERWRWYAHARVFASPTIAEGHVFVGANTGRLTELDPQTGEEIGFLLLTERITNKPLYDAPTKRFFVPTFANEIYCVERSHDQT